MTRFLPLALSFGLAAYAQQTQTAQAPAVPGEEQSAGAQQSPGAQQAPVVPRATPSQTAPPAKSYVVDVGTHIPLSLINSISTRNAVTGDRIYLETAFPVLVDGRIVIPPGSYVAGTITEIKRPGKVKGRGEFHLRFDSLTLPNGATRDFRAHVTGLDGSANEELDHKEGTIRSEGGKAADTGKVIEATATGASIGALAGAVNGTPGMGTAIGAGAGAMAALAAVMFTRGPDAVLVKGTTIEMILDRQVKFAEDELDFTSALPRRSAGGDAGAASSNRRNQSSPYRPRSPL